MIAEDFGITLEHRTMEALGRATRLVLAIDQTTIVEGAGRSPDIAIDAQLSKINVKPSDIKYVVLGHFHVGHLEPPGFINMGSALNLEGFNRLKIPWFDISHVHPIRLFILLPHPPTGRKHRSKVTGATQDIFQSKVLRIR